MAPRLPNDFEIASTSTPIAGPKVTALASGGFVVTYGDDSTTFPEVGYGIRAQIFSPDGVAFGGEIIVPSDLSGTEVYSDVAALPNGGFFIAWVDVSGDDTIRGQAFDVLGNRVGTETIINTQDHNNGGTDSVSVSALQDGRVVVALAEITMPMPMAQTRPSCLRSIDPRDGVVFGGDGAA